MKFKHWATDKIIEVEKTESTENEIVYCKELDKYFKVHRGKGIRTSLEKTSYVEYLGDGK